MTEHGRRLGRRSVATGLAAGALGALAGVGGRGQAQAQDRSGASGQTDETPLREAVGKLAERVGKLGGTVGVAVVEVNSGRALVEHEADRALNPASNAKLATAATALAKLGPEHRFATSVEGRLKGGVARSLVLRGTGDPSLTEADIGALASELKAAGLTRVDGEVLVDQGFFDDLFVPPAFEQQPGEWAWFRAPVSAVAVDGNTVSLRVRPGDEGEAAVVSATPAGFVDIDGTVQTIKGKAQTLTLALEPAGKRLRARVGGAIPVGKPVTLVRRVDDPSLLAGHALRAALIERGVTVRGEVRAGGETTKGGTLAQRRSRPLGQLVHELGKQSDNFVAEMLFKVLALESKGRPAHAADGASVVEAYLREIGAWQDGFVVKNGSGLFDANRTTTRGLVKLLRHAWREPTYGSEFVAQLAVGGQDGTLRGRFRKAAPGALRAKTGTLDAVVARDPLAFSILVNGVSGHASEARDAIDRMADALLRRQWG